MEKKLSIDQIIIELKEVINKLIQLKENDIQEYEKASNNTIINELKSIKEDTNKLKESIIG